MAIYTEKQQVQYGIEAGSIRAEICSQIPQKIFLMNWHPRDYYYRLSGDFESALPYPTPLEFATFIIDESKRIGIEYLDIHFRPQWFSCPFCALDFDIIGSHEEFESDFDFFVSEFGLKVSLNIMCFILFP